MLPMSTEIDTDIAPITWWGQLLRLGGLALATAVVLPLFAVVAFSLSTYISEPLTPLLGLPEEYAGKILFAARAVLIAIATTFLYFALTDWLNRRISGETLTGLHRRERIEPWLFVGPALLLLLLFLVYPAFETFRISLTGDVPLLDGAGQQLLTEAGQPRETTGFIGFANYGVIFASESFWLAIRNSVLWLMVVPTACIVFGMAIAVLADNVRWGQVAKSLIFVPLAISFVGAAVIWRNIFAAGGTDPYEVGLLNAALSVFGVEPRFWYETEFWGNFFMMWILVWIQTGFAMVIFSAALRSVPTETIEAARIDGASETGIFFKVILPQILGTVTVVWTTLVILVLKVFDIPYALTANKDDKLLLATFMEQTRTAQREDELAAAIAIILMITIIPIMVFNLWRMRRERND